MKVTEEQKRQFKKYYQEHKDRIKENALSWRAANPGRVQANHKRYNAANRERLSINARAYRQARLIEIMSTLGNKCSRCGIVDKRCLQIHHKSPGTKLDKRDYFRKDYDLSLVELICANCHMIEHVDYRKDLNVKYK